MCAVWCGKREIVLRLITGPEQVQHSGLGGTEELKVYVIGDIFRPQKRL